MQPVKDYKSLRNRIYYFLKRGGESGDPSQLDLDVRAPDLIDRDVLAQSSVTAFLQFLSVSLPSSEIYLFGGVLRDLALLGRRGFDSDIDLVIDGDWEFCKKFLKKLNADRNKFGGFRLLVWERSVDIWNARETWAISKGLVEYNGISSLTRTTVLNWDSILMNWRTGLFIHCDNYIEDLLNRYLDIILVENPNPLGMVVRIFRHLCMKDARKISVRAAQFLAESTLKYSYNDLVKKEVESYGAVTIDERVYNFFDMLSKKNRVNVQAAYSEAANQMQSNAFTIPNYQFSLPFEVEE